MTQLRDVVVVNLYGGPGTGKSTNASRIFYELKTRGINCELVQEYAKRKTWEKNHTALADQVLVFAKQHHAMITAAQEVECIVTDSPLLLSLIYNTDAASVLNSLVIDRFSKFNNLNFFLVRLKEYNPSGRNQTKEEAEELDVKIAEMLNDNISIFTHLDTCEAEWPQVNAIVDKAFETVMSVRAQSIKAAS